MRQTKLKSKSPGRDRLLARTLPARKEASASELDPVIHERMRLGIISALAVRDSLTFSELKRLLEATDGNLSVHARKLEEAGYLICEKSFRGRMPLTEYAITTAGRKALAKYLDHMEALIKAMKDEEGVNAGK